MAISEQMRHQLYSRLESVLGAQEAATLMEHLPPVGWADVATKRDLEVLGLSLRAEIHQQARTLFLSMLGLQISAAALVVAASRLL